VIIADIGLQLYTTQWLHKRCDFCDILTSRIFSRNLSFFLDAILLPHASKVLFSALSVTFLFVCASNISGIAEPICAKFTVKTCLVPRSDEFEYQGQRLRSSGRKPGKLLRHPHWQCIVRRAPYAANFVQQQTRPFRGDCRGWRGNGSPRWRELSADCVRCMFGKTSYALVIMILAQFTAAALFALTLFRRGRIIHGATYFEDTGQRPPVRDVATIVQYDTIAARSSHGARPTTVPRHRALCRQTDPPTDAFNAY